MFWGITVKAGDAPVSVPLQDRELTVCMAVLDPTSICLEGNASAHLFVKVNGREELLLATLNKNRLGHPLNLEFEETDRVAFLVKGNGTVCLAGNMDPTDDGLEGSSAVSSSETAGSSETESDATGTSRDVSSSPNPPKFNRERGRQMERRHR